MARKLIIDCDPGIDDAIALVLALCEPRLEVVAITATAGTVSIEQSASNVAAVIEQIDPSRYPRMGVASPLTLSPGVDGRGLHGEDGLGNLGLEGARTQRQLAAEKLLADEVRAAPGGVTLLCTGPLTNISRALQRDPGLGELIDRVVITGGSVQAGGDVTAAAEFNIYCDPESARHVLRSPLTKTLIPLDVVHQFTFSVGLLQELPRDASRAGRFLRRMLPHAFRAYHQRLGTESVRLQALIGLLAVLEPGIFRMEELQVDVETVGQLTLGTTVFDRRHPRRQQSDTEVALEIDAVAAMQHVRQLLEQAGAAT
jgi:non-specific riboncleoside hydrolase